MNRQLLIDGKPVAGAVVVAAHVDAPRLKARTVDVPGAHGDLDMAGSFTGGEPLWERRQLTANVLYWTADPKAVLAWLKGQLHGRVHDINVDGQPGHWRGRVNIGGAADHGTVVPFVLSSLVDPWRWDDTETVVPVTGAAAPGATFTLSPTSFTVAPKIKASAACTVAVGGKQWAVPATTAPMPLGGFVLQPGLPVKGQLIGAGVSASFSWLGGAL